MKIKLVCPADKNAVAVSEKPITQNMLNAYRTALLEISTAEEEKELKKAITELMSIYEMMFDEVRLKDVKGNEYQGVQACFEGVDTGDVDAAVQYWFSTLPQILYDERQSLGKPKSGN